VRALNCYLNALQTFLNICRQETYSESFCRKWFVNLWAVVKISAGINILSLCQPWLRHPHMRRSPFSNCP